MKAIAWRSALSRAPALALCAAGAVWLAVLVLRAGFPYHLEWLESNVFCHSLRFALGHPLYEDPSRGLPSHPYGPLYYLVAGGLLEVFPPSLIVCRAISQIAAVWSAVCIARLSWRWSGRSGALIIAPLAWFAFMPATGNWYDLARVDSLATALLLQGILWLEGARRGDRRWWAAAVALSLSALAKQSCLPLALAAWACSPHWRSPRSWLGGAALTTALTAGAYLLVDRTTGGMALYYTLTLPMGHPQEWLHCLSLVMLPALALPLAGAAALASPPARGSGSGTRLLCLWALTLLACAWTGTKQGAYLNHFLPLAALGAALAGGVAAEIWGSGISLRHGIATTLLLGVAAIDLASEDPLRQIPTSEDRAAGDAWVEWLRSCPVEVQIPAFTYLPVLAGKSTHVHDMGAYEVFDDWTRRLAEQHGSQSAAERMLGHPDIAAALGIGGAPTVFVIALTERGEPGISYFHNRFLRARAEWDRWSYPGRDTFRCKVGLRVRPELLYAVPETAAAALPPIPRSRSSAQSTRPGAIRE